MLVDTRVTEQFHPNAACSPGPPQLTGTELEAGQLSFTGLR